MLGLGLGIVSVAIRRRAGGLTSSVALTIGALDAEASPAELAFTTNAVGTLFWGVAATALIPSQLLAGEGLAAGDVLVSEDGGSASVDLSALPARSYFLSAIMQQQSTGARSAVRTLAFNLTSPFAAATGGAASYLNMSGTFYRLHTFTESGTLTVTNGGEVDALLVGGGGAGGARRGGGGGAGRMVEAAAVSVATGSYTIGVGLGGAPGGNPSLGGNGGNTTALGLIALGGGGGGRDNTTSPPSGGSGGGTWSNAAPGQANAASGGFGFNGGSSFTTAAAGGGGGAGATGGNGSTNNGGQGGAGRSNSITGAPVIYAGGGGGTSPSNQGSGGEGGGGAGVNGGAADRGEDGKGAGGGGQYSTGDAAGAGGAGVVILRYEVSEAEYLENA